VRTTTYSCNSETEKKVEVGKFGEIITKTKRKSGDGIRNREERHPSIHPSIHPGKTILFAALEPPRFGNNVGGLRTASNDRRTNLSTSRNDPQLGA
jgi:hypothetical protein